MVTALLGYAGGGPNATGSIAMTDDAGLVLAIGRLPDGWVTSSGKKVHEHAAAYDVETHFALRVTAPTADTVELVASPWSAFAVGHQRFVGTGQIGSRVLTSKLPPPDWTSSWLDVAIVRSR